MQLRTLGHSDLTVSSLCLGGNVFGWTADEATSFQVLDAFVAANGNFIDTADVYSRFAGLNGGESETIIGKWLKRSGQREKVVIATKVGGDMGQGKNLSRKYILNAVESSLQRLQTDYIDLYQSHWDDEVTPVGETLETYAELVRQGKVRAIGASNLSASRLLASLEYSQQHDIPRYESLQPLYNLYDRAKYEQEYEKIAREHGLGVITYFSLASGFLSGKYRSEADLAGKSRSRLVAHYLNKRGLRILDALDEVSKCFNTTPTQIALVWLLARPGITAPIVSATSPAQLQQIVAATDIELDRAAIELLDRASEDEKISI